MTKDKPRSKVREAVLEYLTAASEGVSQMAVTKLSSKNQITLPVDMVRRLGLKPGRRLMLRLEDDQIVLRPEPDDWVEYLHGSAKGVYGNTREEMDAYVQKERASWRRRQEKIGS